MNDRWMERKRARLVKLVREREQIEDPIALDRIEELVKGLSAKDLVEYIGINERCMRDMAQQPKFVW